MMIMNDLQELINISRFYGEKKEFVVAGGGNTSLKNKDKLWVKASGYSLASITEEGFAVLDRRKLDLLSGKTYSEEPDERERQVKNDIDGALITKDKRPSVESSLHNLISYKFVVHLHPDAVNGVLCSRDVENLIEPIFGTNALYFLYTDPGYVLFREVETRVNAVRSSKGCDPKVIVLQNHGIFVSADTTKEIISICDNILKNISKAVKSPIPEGTKAIDSSVTKIIPALRAIVSTGGMKILKTKNSELISYFASDAVTFSKVSSPFTPDTIVYCKSKYIYLDTEGSPENTVSQFRKEYERYVSRNGYQPKVVIIKGIGVVAIGDNAVQAETIHDVFESQMKIAWLAESFGGQHFMDSKSINYIDNWEVENYRRRLSVTETKGRVKNKVVVVTGAAMGFGEGIARIMKENGANVVVADLNEIAGRETTSSISQIRNGSHALFVKTDVSDMMSLNLLIYHTVCEFGGIDVFVSNAGILRAGSLEEMTVETFDQVTRVNYNAYFYCTKTAVAVMKLQTGYNERLYCDIIQINSKSGLAGSKKNFAYSGGKFGGIGLTQAFALELAPYRIKVNSICPGNYYEGPLWSDPVNGLFVQYLNAGKVPGARSIEDVKAHYLAQVPLGKGCSPEDVAKAIFYVIDQENETGQAIPVTGGQIMIH
jgi:rhamnose utilization protein RhaD (predicted bifunctional aldolase and dehydrogenase)/NAD(P)-dependent dehydrogenase (short-subunit alcohol dehydrogenase family)